MAEFRINQNKVVEALVYLASKRPRIDVFHVAKVLFYADLNHLLKYGRPILGDTYVAMDDGPVPSFALNVAKRNCRFVSDEILRIADDKLSVDESDGYVRLMARATFDDSSFSRTDIECLDESIIAYAEMPFMKLWQLIHKWQPYKDHYISGTSTPIPYEDFIPKDTKDREKIIEQLNEHAPATEL